MAAGGQAGGGVLPGASESRDPAPPSGGGASVEQRESLWRVGVGVGRTLPPLQIGGWGAAHLLRITSS